jgi:F-type H+-transporting ATPase subunit epsilon
MAAPEMNVQLVAVERRIWSGRATFVFARTTVGEVGILPSHVPVLAQLAEDEMVRIDTVGEGELNVLVNGGFMSVTEEGVSILAESAELSDEIDTEAARRDLESDDDALRHHAQVRLRAAEQAA